MNKVSSQNVIVCRKGNLALVYKLTKVRKKVDALKRIWYIILAME